MLHTKSGKPSKRASKRLRRGDRFRAEVLDAPRGCMMFMPARQDSDFVLVPLTPRSEEFLALLKPAPEDTQAIIWETDLRSVEGLERIVKELVDRDQCSLNAVRLACLKSRAEKTVPECRPDVRMREQLEPNRAANTEGELKAEVQQLKSENRPRSMQSSWNELASKYGAQAREMEFHNEGSIAPAGIFAALTKKAGSGAERDVEDRASHQVPDDKKPAARERAAATASPKGAWLFTLSEPATIESLGTLLDEQIEAESEEAVGNGVAQPVFPDLRPWRDALGRARWCSPEATPKADQLGFWSDAEGRVWATPYLVQAGAVVFSDPPEICVGRWVEAGFGVAPEPHWEDVVAAIDLAPGVVTGIRNYLGLHPPIWWDSEEGSKGGGSKPGSPDGEPA